LGIIASDDLKWDKQCTAAVKQVNKILGMIKRNSVDRSKETMVALYKNTCRFLRSWSWSSFTDPWSIEGWVGPGGWLHTGI